MAEGGKMEFDNDAVYIIEGRTLNAIWRRVYKPLIEDDGSPRMAIKGDIRRDMALHLGALLSQGTVKQT